MAGFWRRARVGAALGVVALVIAVAAVSAGAKNANSRQPSQVVVARKLAGELRQARTRAAREAVLQRIMHAANIGVVSRQGKPLAVALEAGAAARFQVYDIELGALADQLGRPRTATLDDVASELAAVGLALDTHHTPLPGAMIDKGVTAAVQEALKKPTHGASFLPLLVRDLGLQHGYDLAHRVAAQRVKLDPVQAWLIAADVTLPVLRQLPAPKPAHAAADVGAGAASAASDCARYNQALENLSKEIQKQFGGGLKGIIGEKAVGYIYGKLKGYVAQKVVDTIVNDTPWSAHFLVQLGLESAKNAAALAAQLEGLLHSSLLAYSVDAQALDQSLRTHWLHPGDSSTGKPLTFRVRLQMLDDLGPTLVACGGLVGADIPAKGPISGVKVLWKQEGESPLTPDMGKLDGCTLGVCTATTGPDGIASITFTPQTELIPGYGLEQEKTGLMTGYALYQSRFGAAIPGLISQVLVPKYGQTRWFVTYHKEPKLELRFSTEYDATYTNQNKWCDPLGCETTGTGQDDRAFGAAVPLTKALPSDGGAPIWTGQGQLRWNKFNVVDDGAGALCQDGYFGLLDTDGISSSPGTLIVDSLDVAPNGADPGVTLTLHSNPNPTFTEKSTYHHQSSRCQDYTQTYTNDWPLEQILAVGDPSIAYVGSGGGAHSSEVMKITNWKRGPASHGGAGVYAYHDFSTSGNDGYGQPYSGHIRLEIYATPDS